MTLRNCYKSSLRCFNNCALFLDVDPVQELADILVLDKARLVHQGARPAHKHYVSETEPRAKNCVVSHEGVRCTPGHILYAVALKQELVLDIHVFGALHTLAHGDSSDDLLTQEVTDGELVTPLLCVCVDGEMRIHQPHLVPASPMLHWSPRQDIATKLMVNTQNRSSGRKCMACVLQVCADLKPSRPWLARIEHHGGSEHALVAERHASDHILYVANHCSQGREALARAEMDLDLELLGAGLGILHQVHIGSNMRQIFGEFAPGACNCESA